MSFLRRATHVLPLYKYLYESVVTAISLANLIREGVATSEASEPLQEDVVFADGLVITELHTRLELEPKLRERLLSSRGVSGSLFCEMCGAPPLSTNIALQEAHFEAHHIIPLSNTGVRKTRLSDLALLCANCHRLLHRAIAIKKRWLTVTKGKVICGV
ncbi:MAG: HNH endonuclease [Methylotenera sp.]|nr:HNH endonuclease [Methylotenera sp.]